MRPFLRQSCLRTRTIHTTAFASAAKTPPAPNTNPASATAPFPPKARPPENDPTYVHPPSIIQGGSNLKGVQILKDKAEVIALPDDYYPDWLWQLLDDPKSVEEREAARREVEKKKEIWVRKLEEERREKQLEESKRRRVVPEGVKRTKEEKAAVKRDAQNEAWLLNKERDYEVPQFEMPPERSARFHKKINKEKIKQDNYMREKGMK